MAAPCPPGQLLPGTRNVVVSAGGTCSGGQQVRVGGGAVTDSATEWSSRASATWAQCLPGLVPDERPCSTPGSSAAELQVVGLAEGARCAPSRMFLCRSGPQGCEGARGVASAPQRSVLIWHLWLPIVRSVALRGQRQGLAAPWRTGSERQERRGVIGGVSGVRVPSGSSGREARRVIACWACVGFFDGCPPGVAQEQTLEDSGGSPAPVTAKKR